MKARAEAKAGTGQFFEHFNEVDRPLRLYASSTLYEVAFARKGSAAARTLRENQDWINDHANRMRFTEKVGQKFDEFVSPASKLSKLVRGKVDLGDVFLACFARAKVGREEFAIATHDGDFFELPVTLVKEFLPPERNPR